MMTATFPGTSVDRSTSCIALEQRLEGMVGNGTTAHQGHVDTNASNNDLGDADTVGDDCIDAIPVIMPSRLSKLLSSLPSRNLPRSLGTTTRLTEMMIEFLTHSSAGCVLLL
ncbi:hypothetical protein QBC45DRAFT_450518 [Copromyces sp. CBS 386.78]|nr:hypothetical protein QBC45DRAFT_450518 [Copromyces sp. CBS 386.78]